MNNEDQSMSGALTMEAAVPQDIIPEQTHSEQDRQVPLVALESERAKRQHLEDENRMMKDHFALLQSQQQVKQEPAQDDFAGLEDSDVMTVGEFKKLTSKLTNQFSMTLEEMKIQQKHPDYQEVINKYLPEVFKSNPNLRSTLQRTQDYDLAYYLAKNSDAYKADNKKIKRSEDADRILKNTQSAGTLSSMGSSTPVNQAKSFKSMSDEEFRNFAARNMG